MYPTKEKKYTEKFSSPEHSRQWISALVTSTHHPWIFFRLGYGDGGYQHQASSGLVRFAIP
jgi:hypothetical protein